MIENPPAKQETWVRSWGWEEPLEKEIATHSSILAWEIPWREEPGIRQSMELQRIGHNLAIKQLRGALTLSHTNTANLKNTG